MSAPAHRLGHEVFGHRRFPRVMLIQNRSDVAAALAQPQAFLFLWVNWAVHAMHSRALVAKAIAAWHADCPNQPVPYYTADVSDQCGEVWDALAEWLTAEGRPAGELMMPGVGSLPWVWSGHVVLHVAAPLLYDAARARSGQPQRVCGSGRTISHSRPGPRHSFPRLVAIRRGPGC